MSEDLHPAQIAALKKLTLAQRLELGMSLINEMRSLRAAILRQEHPEWTEEQVDRALRGFVLHAAS